LEEEEGKFNDLEREFQELSSELEKRKTEIESKKDNIEDLRRDRDVLLESIGNTGESKGTDDIDAKKPGSRRSMRKKASSTILRGSFKS